MNVMDMLSLEGKTVVITGGAGLYGRQIVEALAEAGATTYIASRNLEALNSLAEEHRRAGRDVRPLRYDQSDETSIQTLRDTVVKQSGTVHVLINNAVARIMKDWNDGPEIIDRDLHINGTGLFMITREFGKPMVRQKSGSIINIGSMMGMVGIEQHNYEGTDMGSWNPAYFYQKGGMINFTRFCASYFGRYNVRVNCISPGGLWQPSTPQRFVENYSRRTQLGRMANQSDLKGIIVLLASEASAYITGANIPVDGGYTAK